MLVKFCYLEGGGHFDATSEVIHLAIYFWYGILVLLVSANFVYTHFGKLLWFLGTKYLYFQFGR